MRRPRLAVLNASHGDTNTKRNFRRELDADLAEFEVTEGDLPPVDGAAAASRYDGVVVTGSRASVYWEEAWIPPTREWVRDAAESGLPCLGVCWGHQLLADALGGTVEPMGEYEIGYRTVERVGDSVLLEGLDDAFTAFTTHSDAVTELPPGAEPIAENDYSVHGFRLGTAFGVQFHPEYDPETAEEVTRGKEGQLSPERIESVVEGITPEAYDAACEAKALFDNFLSVVERQCREGTVDAASAD